MTIISRTQTALKISRALLVASILAGFSSSPALSQDVPHSWETVPLFAHFGDNQGLTDEEIKFIAENYDFITLEKMHGNATYGNNELGTLRDARKIKELNPDAKILFYWNLFLDYPNYVTSDSREDAPSWFLKNADGTPSLKPPNDLPRYDLTDPGFQSWWVNVAAVMTEDPAIDGVFIDALPQIASRPNAAAESWGAEKAKALEESINVMFEALKERMGDENLLLYNGIRSVSAADAWDHGGMKYLKHADGVMVEHFGHFASGEPAQIEADLEHMIEAGRQGKIVALKGFPEFTWIDKDMMAKSHAALYDLAKGQIDFPLAAFLISAGNKSYFNYSWGYRADFGNLDWYPEFDKKLGAPKGPAEKSGSFYTREFEHADVKLDINNKVGTISWR